MVIRSADARFRASIISSNSIRLRSTGVQVGWITKTSAPRTFSLIWRYISPSENCLTMARPAWIPSVSQISVASGGLAFPEKTCRRL